MNRAGAIVGRLALLVTLSTATAGAQQPPAAVAEVDGVPITDEEVGRLIGMQLAKIETQIYQFKLQTLEVLIAEKLVVAEAAKRKMSVAALLDAEVTSRTTVVSEQEIEAHYQANKPQFVSQGEQAARAQIRATLQNEKLNAARQAFLRSLRSQSSVTILLKPPLVYRAPITVAGARSLGRADAPVTVIEFSDYHCPFCKRAEETVAQIRARYGDRVRLVFKDFPIDQLHPQSRRAHEAARCAAEQSRFWEYHALLFAGPPQATPEQLKGLAERAGIDVATFEQCLAQGLHKAAIQKDVDEGVALGVAATPTFFINGRPLSGAQPLETFVRLIDDELAAAPAAGTASLPEAGRR
jgi:protein-disulfide isomerase